MLRQVVTQVRCGEGVEVVHLGEQSTCTIGGALADLAGQRSNGRANLGRPRRTITVPERHLRRYTWRRRDHDSVKGDLFDTPCSRAQTERLADARLVDHLLIEFTHPRPVGKKHPVQTTIGDSAGIGHRKPQRTGPCRQAIGIAIPHHPRSQTGEFGRRISAVEQIEYRIDEVIRCVAICRSAPGNSTHTTCGDPIITRCSHHRHNLLRQHIECRTLHADRLDIASDHGTGHRCRFEQITAMFGVHRARRGAVDRMPGPADAL